MARSILPPGILPPSKTAAYDALIGKSLEQEGPIRDARLALLKEGIQDHTKRISQAHIRDMDLIDTGNPIENERLRLEKDRNRGMNLYDDKVIRDAMKGFKTQDAIDYTSDLNLEKAIRGEDHRVWDENTMRTLNRSDPNYLKKLGAAVQHSAQYGINAPALTAAAAQAFARTDTQFALNKDASGVVIPAGQPGAGDTVTNAMKSLGLNPNDPKSFNTNTYNAAKRVGVNNMAKNNRHIRDRKVFEARFDKMITNHPVYGQKFKLGRADEAGMTIDTQTLEGFATKISEGVNDRDPLTGEQTVAGRKAVVSSMNGMLSYMRRNKLKKEDLDNYDDLIVRTLERDPLTSTAIFKAVGVVDPEKQAVIDTNFQAKAKKYVREYYRREYPELTDRILTKAYDRIINSGSDNISVATQIGKDNAILRAKRRTIQAETKQKIYTENLVKLREIQNDTLPNNLIKVLANKLNTDHPEERLSQNDRRRLRDQIRGFSRIMESRVGKNLTGETRAAFLLTTRRMAENNVSWDTGSKIWGLNVTDADFGLTSNDEMNKENVLALMELFHENIPHSDTIAAAKGKEIKLKKGAETLKKQIGDYVKRLKNVPPKSDAVPSFFTKALNALLK